MPFLRRSPRVAPDLCTLLKDAGRNVERSTVLLRDLIADYPDNADLGEALVDCEHDGDRITHDLIHRLEGTRRRDGMLRSGDGHLLATALDDIVDLAEQTGDVLGIYHVEAPMDQAGRLAEVLVASGAEVHRALDALCAGEDMAPHLVEIHRLENEGDRLSRDAVASLFATGIDPMVVIRWKDIFESLEAAVDACEHVANVLEGIALKARRR